jgi:hypothetical protein
VGLRELPSCLSFESFQRIASYPYSRGRNKGPALSLISLHPTCNEERRGDDDGRRAGDHRAAALESVQTSVFDSALDRPAWLAYPWKCPLANLEASLSLSRLANSQFCALVFSLAERHWRLPTSSDACPDGNETRPWQVPIERFSRVLHFFLSRHFRTPDNVGGRRKSSCWRCVEPGDGCPFPHRQQQSACLGVLQGIGIEQLGKFRADLP